VSIRIGWDIGGAHLKAVQLDSTGKVQAASQVYCPLWRGLHELSQAMDNVLNEFNCDKNIVIHFVTMTGELADIFPNRHAGVMQIAQFITKKLSGEVQFYASENGFVAIDSVEENTANIASMNWLASVQYLAKNVQQAIFLDIGSTTTDIALIDKGKPVVLGFNDAMRMQTDALVYTGVVRTPLMAITQKIPFAGNMVNVAAEHFATTADVYTLTGDLSLAENMAETADGADKSVEASARRMARMIGWDVQDATLSAWRNLAYAFKHTQVNQIKQAMLRQISLLEDCRGLRVVGAGAGGFLADELAKQLGFKYESIANLIVADSRLKNNDEIRNMTGVCFPAYAVACLGAEAQ
jgi:(4-(4-[2-(gamma-L-glutamylamino)ethyl]phenoxymethyl)furan-2-yl)methanamine synthase